VLTANRLAPCAFGPSLSSLWRFRHDHSTRASRIESVDAAFLGAAIGFERQWRQRLAGLRTNTLVALGASDIRTMLVQEVAGLPDLHFSELDSAFIEDTGRVEVTAPVTSQKRRELAIEAIVGRFSQTDGVTRAAWRLTSQT
jgi:uncharacterized membrane protein YhiD involved in acid resistance